MIGLRFFPLKSADVSEVGTREEPLKTSAWEARVPVTVWQLFSESRGCWLKVNSTV